MDFLVPAGVAWIVAIQALGAWLETPMRCFSFLGTEEFFLLVLPLVYWCIDAPLGVRVGLILVTGNCLNCAGKLLLAGPRPYWVSAQVLPLSTEATFGVPSGHSQHSLSVWGMIASGVGRRWAWALAFALAFIIGFSRWYLGVHFPHDVFVGWVIGGAWLWVFLHFWDRVAAALARRTLGSQVLIALAASLIFVAVGAASAWRLAGYTLPEAWARNALRAGPLPDPATTDGVVASAAMLLGLGAGIAWLAARGGFEASGPIGKRALRFVVGLAGVVVLWMGLEQILPAGADLLSAALRYARYALVGSWVAAGAPWVFLRLKLAEKPGPVINGPPAPSALEAGARTTLG
jgi:membrane-associated phospholipid phosphatase